MSDPTKPRDPDSIHVPFGAARAKVFAERLARMESYTTEDHAARAFQAEQDSDDGAAIVFGAAVGVFVLGMLLGIAIATARER